MRVKAADLKAEIERVFGHHETEERRSGGLWYIKVRTSIGDFEVCGVGRSGAQRKLYTLLGGLQARAQETDEGVIDDSWPEEPSRLRLLPKVIELDLPPAR